MSSHAHERIVAATMATYASTLRSTMIGSTRPAGEVRREEATCSASVTNVR